MSKFSGYLPYTEVVWKHAMLTIELNIRHKNAFRNLLLFFRANLNLFIGFSDF